MVEDLAPSKRALRAEVRERRRIMTASERDATAAGLLANMKRVVDQYAAGRIACYLSINDEPPTREFLDWAVGEGLLVYLPVAREDGLMDWAPYESGDEAQDVLGMPIPTSEVLGPIALADADVVFVPAASVAPDGMRLGWGRGYYDRALGTLGSESNVFAVVYDHELVDDVPREKHDQPVDGMVTPSQIISVHPVSS